MTKEHVPVMAGELIDLVDPRAGELQMVATRGAGLADRADLGVLVGRIQRRQVGQRCQGGVALHADRGLRIAQLPAARGERGELLALLGRRRTLAPAAGAVLLGL